MKICIFSDPHWCSFSSIVTDMGERFSVRLEHLIDSINFVERQAELNDCDSIFCLGDFFDKALLSSDELTALNKIEWSPIPHVFLVGNHEITTSDISRSSTHVFNLIPNCTVIDKPVQYEYEGKILAFLPYLGKAPKHISDYLPPTDLSRVIFSHNDLKGVNFGHFISKNGLELSDIEANCDLFLNGHLHNFGVFGDKVFNVGNICGQNFSEDAFTYTHNMFILDLNTLNFDRIENPYSFNFYKIDLTTNNNLTDLCDILNKVSNNAVCTIKCYSNEKQELKDILDSSNKIIKYRLIIENVNYDKVVSKMEKTTVDHCAQFSSYIILKYGSSNEKLIEELSKVVSNEN